MFKEYGMSDFNRGQVCGMFMTIMTIMGFIAGKVISSWLG